MLLKTGTLKMKYIIGSLIISFGILLVLTIISISMGFTAPEGSMKYYAIAWLVLAILSYPLAKKIVRE